MKRAIWILTLATVALFAVLSWLTPRHEEPVLYGYSSPVLALQMARNWAELATILSLAPEQKARFVLQTRLDFGFLLAYGALFVAMLLDAYGGKRRWALASLALGAALCDGFENVWTLAVLALERGYENYMAQAIRQWALLKFFLLGAAWLAIGFGQPRHGRRLVLGVLYCVAGLMAWWGCIDNHRLLVAYLPLGAAFALQLWLYSPWSDVASFRSRATASGSSL